MEGRGGQAFVTPARKYPLMDWQQKDTCRLFQPHTAAYNFYSRLWEVWGPAAKL